MKAKAEIAAYCAERNAMLLKGDVDALIAFNEKHGNPPFSSRELAEVTLHKMCTAVETLPFEVRNASRKWLRERGYRSLDDGDLTDA
jgi:hypothetical protein